MAYMIRISKMEYTSALPSFHNEIKWVFSHYFNWLFPLSLPRALPGQQNFSLFLVRPLQTTQWQSDPVFHLLLWCQKKPEKRNSFSQENYITESFSLATCFSSATRKIERKSIEHAILRSRNYRVVWQDIKNWKVVVKVRIWIIWFH